MAGPTYSARAGGKLAPKPALKAWLLTLSHVSISEYGKVADSGETPSCSRPALPRSESTFEVDLPPQNSAQDSFMPEISSTNAARNIIDERSAIRALT